MGGMGTLRFLLGLWGTREAGEKRGKSGRGGLLCRTRARSPHGDPTPARLARGRRLAYLAGNRSAFGLTCRVVGCSWGADVNVTSVEIKE